MGSTLDSKLISKMIHLNCEEHHCSEDHTGIDNKGPQPSSILDPLNGDVPAPEYLHCGFWPRPLTKGDVDEESHEPRGLHDHHDRGMGRSRPAPSSTSMRQEWAAGHDSFKDEDEPESIRKSRDHHSVVTDEFTKAVDAWRMELQNSDLRGGSDNEKARKPYSVLRLFARQNANDRKAAGSEATAETRQSLFEQENAAECRARTEIMEYIDALVDQGDYEDAYACIWPLEEYRRNGWAEEMIFAFPKECWEFVDMVRARQKAK